jgi:lysyl-tRNA synthetase class 2
MTRIMDARPRRGHGVATGLPGRAAGEWAPRARPDSWRLRSRLLARVRRFFEQRNVLEVDTPILSAAAPTDPALEPFQTTYCEPGTGDGSRLYLQPSPEFAMKRLLAAGSGAIYQVCKVFRNGEAGRSHSPEFTMLEWYRPGFDHHQLMDEVEALLLDVFTGLGDLAGGERTSYRQAFRRSLRVDPMSATAAELADCARSQGIVWHGDCAELDRDVWLELLFSHRIQPALGRRGPTFVFDFPASQAALARIRPGAPAVAERFELYLDGVELANGYHELTDATEQARRFARDLKTRAAQGRGAVAVDQRFVAALDAGLPPCAGVALGIDRLLMVAMGAKTLSEVLTFPVSRA